jgi:hypothetical protein
MIQQQCELIVTTINCSEAAIVFSFGTDPVWFTRSYKPVDQLIIIAQNLITLSNDLHLFDNSPGASITYETSFGALYIRSVDSESLLILCLIEGYSLPDIEVQLKKLLSNEP